MSTHAQQRGFTLVELITSLAIFSIVMTLAMGSILSIFSANRRTQNESLVMNNLNLALETMARDMRFGTAYHCGDASGTTPQGCPNGASVVSFLSSDNQRVVYELSGTSLARSVEGGPFINVTAPELIIENLTFHVFGEGPGDNLQPKAVIVIKGHFGSKVSEQIGFSLQTVVSQRVLDNGL